MAGWARKSIDYYAFIGGADFSVLFEKPKHQFSFAWKSDLPMQKGETEISTKDVGTFEHSGRFSWQVDQKRGAGKENIAKAYWEISPVTGSMQVGKYPDSPTNMMKTPSSFSAKDNWAVSYGFYDSGSGIGTDLTNHDQSYVYVTPDVSNWMGDLVKRKPHLADARFSSFVLPGSHDAGTYDMRAVEQIATNSAFLSLLVPFIGMSLAAILAMGKTWIVEIVANFAATQKDDVAMQLNMGARYFDFRPGYCMTGIPLAGDTLYHQHAVIPGVPYTEFLGGLFKWLLAHPSEIAVLWIGFDGFAGDGMKPSFDKLQDVLARARLDARAEAIVLGGNDDLNATYEALIAGGKRLIVLYDSATRPPSAAKKYDSYDAKTYGTTKASNIVGALNKMSTAGQKGHLYTVLQLQGTASTAKGAVAATIADASKSGSPLMSTKPDFDSKTYPWLVQNTRKNLGDGQMIVVLNDFVDNALTLHAIKVMEG